MDLELNVVRFENEDVIATSCGSVYGIGVYCDDGEDGPSFLIYKNGSSIIADVTAKDLPEGLEKDKIYAFHVGSNGKFLGECPNIGIDNYNREDFYTALETHNYKGE